MSAIKVWHREHARRAVERWIALAGYARGLQAVEIVAFSHQREYVAKVLADFRTGAESNALRAIERPALHVGEEQLVLQRAVEGRVEIGGVLQDGRDLRHQAGIGRRINVPV